MRKYAYRVSASLLLVAGLSACQGMSADEKNAGVGAAVGAGIAAATDENIVAGAAIGAAGGALCNDVGICHN